MADLLIVQMEDAREHRGLAPRQDPAVHAAGDQHLDLFGVATFLKSRRGVYAERLQQPVRGGVDEPYEWKRGLPEELQPAGRATQCGLGMRDRINLRDLLSRRDVQERHEQV